MLQGTYKAWKVDFDCIKIGFVLPGGIHSGICNAITRHHASDAIQFWYILIPSYAHGLGYLHYMWG